MGLVPQIRGLRAGYVFQKCFVEFLLPRGGTLKPLGSELVREGVDGCAILRVITRQVSFTTPTFVHSKIRLFCYQTLRTSVPDNGRNAVTWGTFPAKIIQTTIVEGESFLSRKVRLATTFLFPL